MSRQIQIRRGSATDHANFTGAIGEITMDTTNKTLRVHDGTTAGGTILAKQSEIPDLSTVDYVVESQLPTSNNNYTWYRKYKSGWVEQGGIVIPQNAHYQSVTLPVTMADANYQTQGTFHDLDSADTNIRGCNIGSQTTTGFNIKCGVYNNIAISWLVTGMSAVQ